MMKARSRCVTAALSCALLLGGCGGGSDIDDPLFPLILITDLALTLAAGQSAFLLGGDTIGGAPVLLFSNITFELTDTLPNGVTVNNGYISIGSSARTGTTTIRFRVCDIDHPGNCASGKIVLTVAG